MSGEREQVRAVLLDAAEWAADELYCKECYHSIGPTDICAECAILMESFGRSRRVFRAACRAVADHLGIRSLADWGAADERTQAEVVAALRGAAEGLDEKPS